MSWVDRFRRHPDDGQLMMLAECQSSPAAASRLNRHLARCEVCAGRYAEIRSLSAHLGRINLPGVPPQSLLRIRNRLQAEVGAQREPQHIGDSLGRKIAVRLGTNEKALQVAKVLLGRHSTSRLSIPPAIGRGS